MIKDMDAPNNEVITITNITAMEIDDCFTLPDVVNFCDEVFGDVVEFSDLPCESDKLMVVKVKFILFSWVRRCIKVLFGR